MDVPSLLADARTGSADALGELLQRFRPYLLQLANEQIAPDLQSKAGGSDLVQQTFLEARRDYHRFRGTTEGEFVAWLRGILQNNVANFTRHYRGTAKRQVGLEQPLDRDGSSTAHDDLPSRPPDPDDRLARLDAVRRAVERLPPDYRNVIVQHSQHGRTFADIAAETGRTSDAVRKLWGRAVVRLQALMDGEA